ncbi:GMC family oxidoreductase [Roseococcus thiosulfatophilus]|uniref:GMC family oxidoreductase n=1 Tax=Roseococcus thiosulfatophilus TaxID=35813 RepID=UPI001A8DEE71|nr:GMC family oxidoreductase [Roseococcus thiosulfatophilus]
MTTSGKDPALTSFEAVAGQEFDVVIVGSGVSGAVIAKQLGARGCRVLVLEAGSGNEITVADYEESVQRFYGSQRKDNNSAYANPRNAPMPRDYETRKLPPGASNTDGYLVQMGPLEIDSTYTRVLGGTTRHWEGKALRMLPDDFRMRSLFGQGRDWPLAYNDLDAHYRAAERELGVAGDVEDQQYGGLDFGPGYVLPMRKMPLSYLDRMIARDLDGMEVTLAGETFPLKVRSTPQARNGVPNPAYDEGRGYKPVGAVSTHQEDKGERCQGNTNCVPICPVQAKYDARRTLYAALETDNVQLLAWTVASRLEVDGATGQVSQLEFKTYDDPDAPGHRVGHVRAKVFVLAANAVENARLMLASDLPGSSNRVGRNLMDHMYLLTWALMPKPAGALRGPICTAGIEDIRTGAYRRHQAAVRYSIHNDGWGWATGSPYSDLEHLVEHENRFGAALRQGLIDRVSRQFLLDCMIEVLPDESNRVSVDPRWVDQMGNPRPVISFGATPYTLETAAFSRRLSRRIFQRLGAEDHTHYDPLAPGYVSHGGEGYVLRGGNHWAGTHIMGTSARDSVVDSTQRSWDHPNLYLAGAGSMASIGTANTTLTLAALCFRTAEAILAGLGTHAPAAATTGARA